MKLARAHWQASASTCGKAKTQHTTTHYYNNNYNKSQKESSRFHCLLVVLFCFAQVKLFIPVSRIKTLTNTTGITCKVTADHNYLYFRKTEETGENPTRYQERIGRLIHELTHFSPRATTSALYLSGRQYKTTQNKILHHALRLQKTKAQADETTPDRTCRTAVCGRYWNSRNQNAQNGFPNGCSISCQNRQERKEQAQEQNGEIFTPCLSNIQIISLPSLICLFSPNTLHRSDLVSRTKN